jgi:broad specificity phosphatase PhoE
VRLWYVTHADVVIDPEVPVPDWGLTERGRARHQAFAERISGIGSVFCSFERKAVEGAEIIAVAHGMLARPVLSLHENDRSATGYLPGPEFEATADVFFARPREKIRGWERAIDAQYRIVATLKRAVAEAPKDGDIVVVAHGAVGAILRAHLLGDSISRSHDQPQGVGGGHCMMIRLPDWELEQDWTAIEAI